MSSVFTEPGDETVAIERMLDDGSPLPVYPSAPTRRSLTVLVEMVGD